MYKLKSIILLLFFFGLYSCDLLENQQPQQSLPVKGNLDNVSKLKKALIGAYDDLQVNFGEVIYSNDYLSDDVVFTGSFPEWYEIGNQNMSSNNGYIQNMWRNSYEDINDVNIILTKLDGLNDSNVSQAVRDNIRGQSLFIRSVQYYYLLNLFALPSGVQQGESQMGVPLQLDAVISQEDFTKPSRSSVEEVYKRITSDLKKAQDLLPAAGPDGNSRFRANKGAAIALLARIALVRQNYQKAANYAGQVIESKNFNILPDVETYFTNEASSESLFEIQNTKQDVPSKGNNAITAQYNIDVRDAAQIGYAFKQALSNELNSRQKSDISNAGANAVDTRKVKLIKGKNKNGNLIVHKERNAYSGGESNTNKYESSINQDDNIPIIRYSEVILTRAEALARINGVNKESINLLNMIRERAFTVNNGDITLVDYVSADFPTKEDLINKILLERHVELAFEGHRTNDLQRIKHDIRKLPYDSDRLTFPIPQTQIDANKNIKQNPGY